MDQFDVGTLAGVFVSFHASMAGFSFAGLTFLLTWTRSDELDGPMQAARQRALLAMATAVVIFLMAAAQYALTSANEGAFVAAWIMVVGAAPASICAAALLFFSVSTLFRAHGLAFATRVSRRLFDFAYVSLAGYLVVATLGGTAVIAFDGVPIAELPMWLLAASAAVVLVPMVAGFAGAHWPPLGRFVAGDAAFEQLVLTMVAVVSGGIAIGAIALVTQAEGVTRELWVTLVLVGMFGVCASLCRARLVLVSLLDEDPVLPVPDVAPAA